MGKACLTQATPDRTLAYPHPARAWWSVAVFCLAALVSYTDRLILSSLVDAVKASLDLSDSAVSLLQGAAFALVYVTAGLFLGRLADRSHRLTLLIGGVALWCFGTIAGGFAQSFGMLFLARMLVGVGEAALAPAAVSIIADSVPPQQRGTAVGIFLMGTVLGGPMSIATGSIMLSLANAGTFHAVPIVGMLEPWRAVLVLVGAVGLIVPLLLFTLREPARLESAPVPNLAATIRHLVADRRTLAPTYIAMGLLSIGDYGLLSWMPSVLSRRFSMAPDELGWAFGTVTVIAGVLGCLAGGVGSDAAERVRGTTGRLRFSAAAALAAVIGALLVSAGSQQLVLVGLGLWTCASSLAAISGIAAIQSLVPAEYRGVSMALVAFCNTLLGLGFGPTLVALVTEHVYRDPAAVGPAISTVVVPAGLVAVALFVLSGQAVTGRQPRRSLPVPS